VNTKRSRIILRSRPGVALKEEQFREVSFVDGFLVFAGERWIGAVEGERGEELVEFVLDVVVLWMGN
jgi:hypothetical protein